MAYRNIIRIAAGDAGSAEEVRGGYFMPDEAKRINAFLELPSVRSSDNLAVHC